MGGLIVLIALAGTPLPHAQDVLRRTCLVQAADPSNPWALAHGITAFGAGFSARDGALAPDAIIGRYLLPNPAFDGGIANGGRFGFLKYGPGGTPIEPHTNLHLKTLVLAGVPLSRQFSSRAGPVTLGTLLDNATRWFRHVPASEEYWEDAAWTLDALSATHTPKNAALPQSDGTTLDLNRAFDDGLDYLEKSTDEFKVALRDHIPMVPKRRQGLYAHSCGGLHLVQAVLSWARFPAVRARWGARVDNQIAVLFYRVQSERAQYEDALRQAPGETVRIATQMVKFYGHFLETTGRLKKELQWAPQPEHLRAIAVAKAMLDRAVRLLESKNAFDALSDLRAKDPQVFLDLIGDSCHASHGWDFWP